MYLLSYDLLPEEDKERLEAEVQEEEEASLSPSHPVMECTTKVNLIIVLYKATCA